MQTNNFLVWGKDHYLIETKVGGLIRQIAEVRGEEAEVVPLDADEITPRQLAETLDFSPLFSQLRIIIIKKPFWLLKNTRKNNKIEEIGRVWKNYLQSPPTDQFIILTAVEYSSANTITKIFGNKLTVIECENPGTIQLKKWISQQFGLLGFTADAETVALLASTGQNLYYLKNLIEKTCLKAAKDTIDKADIAEDLVMLENTTVFKIIDQLFKRNAKTAITYWHKYMEQEQPPTVALFMFVRQFGHFGKVKYYKNLGLSSREIADRTKMQGFQVRNMEKLVNNFTDNELRQVFASCLAADINIKSSSQEPKLVMEALIFEICNIGRGLIKK